MLKKQLLINGEIVPNHILVIEDADRPTLEWRLVMRADVFDEIRAAVYRGEQRRYRRFRPWLWFKPVPIMPDDWPNHLK